MNLISEDRGKKWERQCCDTRNRILSAGVNPSEQQFCSAGQRPGPIPACHLFFVKFYWNKLCPFACVLSIAAFAVECQTRLIVTETIYSAKLNMSTACPRWRAERGQTTSTGTFLVSTENVKLHSEQAAHQAYFQNNMKTLFIFFIWFSPSAPQSFPEATRRVMSEQTTCRSRQEIQLFSLKPDIKEIWKDRVTFLTKYFFF